MKKLVLLLVAIILNAKVITDSLNRTVNIPDNIKKAVAVGPGALRLVVYLGSQDKIAGIEKREKKFIFARPYILAHKELLKLPVVGMGGPNVQINLEKIISLKPDVIIAGYISKSRADMITAKTGIPVVVISYGKLGTFANEKLFNSIKILGEVFNKQKRAEDVTKYIKNLDKDIKKRKFKTDKKIYIGAVAFKGLHGITSTMPKFPPFKMLGIKNVINSDAKSQIFINKEALFKLNPDVIFIDESGMKFIKDSFIKHLKAYKTHEIYGILPYNNYMTNIGTAYADTYYIGKVLAPGKFKDIDIKQKTDEIYKFLVGKPCYNSMAEFFGGFKKLFKGFVCRII
ncbi:HemV-3 iron (III) ABC transporter, ATP-binding protein [Nautilia profundicola AmH]|uniref:HemV-3 iron (III) ABC transporter, ATP-binding protein n=1 Tax=Nautilia profundicola (strain ATCC BAA-1463 / DSM 18972 / AmH) TaxID=598659 RepID=B9L927_NAUPA|nr:ABC transporter substrate-binding protein [Nautilia profundicola]ACM92502.1 HemV-3 iron (III) ABC transporter, ATP-binding protein [Nautilia profundicola AmH]